MTLAQLKTYLQQRSGTESLLQKTDAQLTNLMNTALMLLTTFYYFEQLTNETQIIKVVSQEVIWINYSSPDFDAFTQYAGLNSFNIGGAVQGTVNYSEIAKLFSRIVKGILGYNCIQSKVSDPDSDIFSTFAKV